MKWFKTSLSLVLILLSMGCVQQGRIYTDDPEEEARVVQIYTDLGLGYLRQEKLDMALEKLQYALELDKNNPDANHYIAEVYKQLGETEEALKHFDKAVDLDPKNPMLLNNYGAFLCEQSRFEDSEKYFLRASSLPRYRTPELTFENLALCAQLTKNDVKAEEYFRKALSIREDMPKSLFQMARLNYEKKEYFRARAFLERFHSAVGYTEQSLKLGIKIEKGLGNRNIIGEYQQELSERFPDADTE